MADLDDDNIIELTDIAKKDSDLSNDDDVIELTDVAENKTINLDLDIEKEDESELDISDSEDAKQIDDGFTEDFFEEDDVESNSDDDELTDTEQIDDEFADDIFADDDVEDNPNDELTDDELTDDDQIDTVVNIMEDESKSEPELEKVTPDDLNIDQEQIEIILERIIEKKFVGKIESILYEVMESVIEKQILEIKESLQKDLE